MVKRKNESCKVLCITTGQVFKTIKDAARFAGANNWTMSMKMTAVGQFTDALGRVYKRLSPMVSKNIYTSANDRVNRTYKGRKMKKKNLPKLNVPDIKGCADLFGEEEIIQECIKHKKKDCPEFVRKAVGERIKSLMKEKGIWEEVCSAMDFCGVKSFSITKE